MEINYKPRRVGMTTQQIEGMHMMMLEGRNIFIGCFKKDITSIERHIIDLFNKGHKFHLKENYTSRMEAIWDKERFEPGIIGFQNKVTFTGYTFELNKL